MHGPSVKLEIDRLREEHVNAFLRGDGAAYAETGKRLRLLIADGTIHVEKEEKSDGVRLSHIVSNVRRDLAKRGVACACTSARGQRWRTRLERVRRCVRACPLREVILRRVDSAQTNGHLVESEGDGR